MFYRFIRGLAWILGHLMYRFEISGFENIPKDGAYVLTANHIHMYDPLALIIFMKRVPRCMAKHTLFGKNRLLDWFWRKLYMYPVNRDAKADLAAYRKTMETLESGEGVMIFSQGTRMKGFDNAKSGVAVFALKTGAPIIPAGITGTYRRFSKLRIHIGEPIPTDIYKGQKVKAELVDSVMETVVSRITGLIKE